MRGKQNLWKKVKSKNKKSMFKDTREELLFRNSLLRFREHLLEQMGTEFDRILSGRLDAVDFLLRTSTSRRKT